MKIATFKQAKFLRGQIKSRRYSIKVVELSIANGGRRHGEGLASDKEHLLQMQNELAQLELAFAALQDE